MFIAVGLDLTKSLNYFLIVLLGLSRLRLSMKQTC